MSAIQSNIDAREQHTSRLTGVQPFPKPLPSLSADEAQDALFGIAYKQPGMATFADCQVLFERIRNEWGSVEADAVLSRFGVWKISDMFIGMYNDFFLYCQSILTYGASPFYGWTLNAITDRVRKRWLMWHPESDDLFVLTVPPTEADFEQGCSDVTGVLEYERRYLAENRRWADPLPAKEEEL